jgi:hypothetical protein
MSIYFILLDATRFHERIVPPLAAAWRQRSFAPCRSLCSELLATVEEFRANFFAGSDEPLIVQVERGLPFDRRFWQTLVGEVLLFAATEVPELQTAPETLCWLLAREQYQREVPRKQFAPIQQAHFGARDLQFGSAIYRPNHVGLNDRDDVNQLVQYLADIDSRLWSASELVGLRELIDDEERGDELAFVRDWLPALVNVYRQAQDRGQVVVCEVF